MRLERPSTGLSEKEKGLVRAMGALFAESAIDGADCESVVQINMLLATAKTHDSAKLSIVRAGRRIGHCGAGSYHRQVISSDIRNRQG